MTEPSAAARPAGARSAVPRPARDNAKPAAAGGAALGWTVAVAGIVWLIVKLWAADQQIHSNAGDTVAIATAALAIPGVMQATALGGLGGALAVRLGLERRAQPPGRCVSRWTTLLVAAAGGLVVGLAAMGAILGAYGDVPSVGGVAAAVAISGLLAGVCAGLGRRVAVVAAALAAALVSFVVDTVLNSGTVLGHMMAGLGAGPGAITDCDQGSAASACAKVVNANSLVSHIDSAIVGVAAGLVAFWYLRRRGGGARFPAYVAAGGATGALLLVAEILTHLGGGGLLHVARGISADDRAVIDLLAGNRVIHGLLVLFIGAIVALFALGRSLGPARRPAADRASVASPPAARADGRPDPEGRGSETPAADG
jgi:hypothetical protein